MLNEELIEKTAAQMLFKAYNEAFEQGFTSFLNKIAEGELPPEAAVESTPTPAEVAAVAEAVVHPEDPSSKLKTNEGELPTVVKNIQPIQKNPNYYDPTTDIQNTLNSVQQPLAQTPPTPAEPTQEANISNLISNKTQPTEEKEEEEKVSADKLYELLNIFD